MPLPSVALLEAAPPVAALPGAASPVGAALFEDLPESFGTSTVTVLPEGIDVEVMKTGGLGGLFFSIDHARFNEAYCSQASTSPLYALIASNDVAAAMMDGPAGQSLTV